MMLSPIFQYEASEASRDHAKPLRPWPVVYQAA